MRGRRGGHSSSSSSSSSSVAQEKNRMSLRKQIIKEATNVPTEIIIDDNSQELESVDDRDGTDELSSSTRHRRRRERENQTKPKEMTEEEMMDLALRLSEQEASNTALQLQREEEAVLKAIQESMVGQTQPCPPSQSQSLLAHASLRLCSRRKLLRSNGMRTSSIDQGASEDVCTPEIDLTRETKGAGDEIKNRNKKRKRKEGSPPLKTSDFSQKIDSQASSGSSEPLDSQSSDSVQLDDRLLRKSPVFLSTDCKALVHIPRLSQDLLETCRSSGFVLCSQDTSSPQTSLPAQTKSPTFPRSPGNLASCPKSPVFSEAVQGDDDETQLTQSLEYLKSPVFGRNTEHETTPSACEPLVSVCENSRLEFSSQESLTSSVRTASRRPQSPVFPRSPALPPPPGKSSICSSPVFSETHRGAAEQSHGFSSSPVFGGSGRKLSDDEPKTSVVPSEVERSNSEVSRAVGEESSQRPTQPCNTDPHRDDVRLNMISVASSSDDSQETPEDLNAAETELTSDMVLVWSDKDEDITPACSPSPVFSEERGAGLADVQVSSLNHDTAASPGAEWRSSSTEEELQPVEGACAPPAVEPTVHYYWGVPFCPRGLDPDAYTQVILTQMDVYDKSLKQAQRRLLRKAPWGGAILPQPEKSPSPESSAESPQRLVPQRRGLRLKKNNQSEESPPAEEEEEGGEQRDGEEEEEAGKEREGGEGEEGRMDTDDCDVCPETQLSNNDDDETQVLTIDSGTELQPESPDLPEVQKIPRDDSPAVVEPPQEEEDEMEVDAAVCGTMEGNIPVSGSDAAHKKGEEIKEDDVDPEVDEIKVRGLQRPTSPEVDPAAKAPSPEARVDCPICQGSFPVTKIEWHAAYCDGEVAVLDERAPEVSSKPRRKRRRAEVTEAEETNDSVNSSRNQEKCFICQKNVPLREYTRHTELCIHRRPPKPDTRGNLLSALEQTENRGSEAGPSGTRIQPGEVIDLRDDDDDDDEEEEGVRALSISNSPIRSFTPISEASGCLIDFRRQQRAKKPSHRRR